jgi:hypothetical protein
MFCELNDFSLILWSNYKILTKFILMHKDQDEKDEHSTMSYNDKGLKFIVNRNKNVFKFKIYNDFTN